MSAFDSYIEEVGRYVEGLTAAGRPRRELSGTADPAALGIAVGPGANPGVILRGDTFAELGNPEEGSCGLVLWTDRQDLVADGRVTLVGPDIGGVQGQSLPFGQVILVAGRGLGPEQHMAIAQSQYVADQVEGFMVRSSSNNLWCRISNEVGARGFSLATLGAALLQLFRSAVPQIDRIEVVFVTSSGQDVRGLATIAERAKQVGRELVERYWKDKGYDLDCDFDCGSCGDKDVCDGVRDIISARAKARVAGNGKGRS